MILVWRKRLGRCLFATTMANVQTVLSALEVFSRAPEKAALEQANTWLQDFQHSVNTHFALVLPKDRDV